jgi:hypothetical protein
MTMPNPATSFSSAQPAVLRHVYLRRLERLVRLRRVHEEELNERGIRLLDHAIFAAYCDCRAVGAEREARDLLDGSGPGLPGLAGQDDRKAS